ncbi:MAG: hypothetical protein WC359_14090 [Dehalococcoidia bacterium]
MKDERCSWMVHRFPRKLKDRFAAAARLDGKSIADMLTYLLQRFLREEYEKTRAEVLKNDK